MGELVVARRYWCHICATAVSPVAAEAGVEIKCPYCSSGFLEEMETARSAADGGSGGGTYPSADNAISIWAPIIDSMVGDPVRRRRNRRTADAAAAAEDELDNLDFSRRRRRATAFLRLLQAIREGQLQRLESAGGGLDAEHYSPFGRSIFAAAPPRRARHGVGGLLPWPRPGRPDSAAGRERRGPAGHAAGQEGGRGGAADCGGERRRRRRRRRGHLRSLPGGLCRRRARPGAALQAQVPLQVHPAVAGDAQLLPHLPVPAAGRRRPEELMRQRQWQ